MSRPSAASRCPRPLDRPSGPGPDWAGPGLAQPTTGDRPSARVGSTGADRGRGGRVADEAVVPPERLGHAGRHIHMCCIRTSGSLPMRGLAEGWFPFLRPAAEEQWMSTGSVAGTGDRADGARVGLERTVTYFDINAVSSAAGSSGDRGRPVKAVGAEDAWRWLHASSSSGGTNPTSKVSASPPRTAAVVTIDARSGGLKSGDWGGHEALPVLLRRHPGAVLAHRPRVCP